MSPINRSLFDTSIIQVAVRDAFAKLTPRHMVRNPVMFVVLVGSLLTTLALVRDIATGQGNIAFTLQIALWLWFTVLFANFAEAMAEGRERRKPIRFASHAARRRQSSSRSRAIISTTSSCLPHACGPATT